MAREALKNEPRAVVEPFSGLTVEYAAERGVCVILRGLRAVSDFEYEFQLALMNRRLQRHIQTVFMMTDYQWLFISSTIVKAAASHGADVKGLCPKTYAACTWKSTTRARCAGARPACPPRTAASASRNERRTTPTTATPPPAPVICLAGPTARVRPPRPCV